MECAMAIKDLNNGYFWVCYLSVVVAIALIPVYVNKSYIKKYKMRFAEYTRQSIDSFCNNECIYAAEFNDIRSVIRVMVSPLCILGTFSVIDMGDTYSTWFLLLGVVVLVLVHVGSIYYILECLFTACFMTNTLMLIRGACTNNAFKIVPLQDIVSYWPTQSGLGVDADIDIFTKNGDVLELYKLKNRDQLIDVLRNFTSATEETWSTVRYPR